MLPSGQYPSSGEINPEILGIKRKGFEKELWFSEMHLVKEVKSCLFWFAKVQWVTFDARVKVRFYVLLHPCLCLWFFFSFSHCITHA